MSHRSRRRRAGAFSLCAAAFSAHAALAQTYTWTGAGPDTNWSTAANWDTPPAFNSGVTVAFNGTTNLTTNASFQPVGAVEFGPSAGAYDLSGLLFLHGYLRKDSPGTTTVSATVNAFTSLQLIANAGTLAFTSSIAPNNGLGLTFLPVSSSTLITASAPISGALASVTKTGNGVLRLTAASNYTGPTSVIAGTLELGHDLALSNSPVTVSGNAALRIIDTPRTLANSFTFSGAVTLGQFLNFTGRNTLASNVLINLNQAMGATTVIDALAESGGARTLTVNAVYLNVPRLLLQGSATFTGGSTLNAPVYVAQSGLGTGPVFISANGALSLRGADATIGQLSGSGSIDLDGNTLTTSSTGTYSGTVTADGGTLRKTGTGTFTLTRDFANTSSFDVTSGTVRFGDGTATPAVVDTPASSNASALEFNTPASTTTTFRGSLSQSATAALTKTGPGTLVLAATTSGPGTVLVSQGTLRIGDGVTSPSDPAGVGALTNNAQLVYNTTGTATARRFLAGSGSLTKTGPGTLTLSAASSFTGPTTVSAGTLALDASGFLNSTSSITVGAASGPAATLRFAASDRFGNSAITSSVPLTVNATGTLASAGSFTTLVNPTLNGGTLLLNGGFAPDFPAFALKGTVSVAGAVNSRILTGTGGFNAINIGPTDAPGPLNVDVAAGRQLLLLAPLQNNVLQSGGMNTNSLTKTGPGTLSIRSDCTYTGGTTVLAGTLEFFTGSIVGNLANSAAVTVVSNNLCTFGTVSGTGSLSVTSGTVRVARLAQGAVTVTGSDSVLDVNAGSATVVLGSLAISNSGTLDLRDNDMVVRSGSLSSLRALVASWWANGAKSGTGLRSSTASSPMTPRDGYATLAVVSNATAFGIPRFTTFEGVAVSATDLLVKYTYQGDTDLSGTLDARDFNTVLSGWANNRTGWENGDINYDGLVNATDFNLFLSVYNAIQSNGYLPFSDASTTAAAVPEPVGLLPLAAGVLPLLRRHRR